MKTKTNPQANLPAFVTKARALLLAAGLATLASALFAAPMDDTTLTDFDFSGTQQTRTQTLLDNGTLELQRVLTGPASGYRHMGWPIATRLPDGRTVLLIRHLLDHSAYASYPDNARRIIWSDDNFATWQPADVLDAAPPFGRNLDDTPTKYDYQGMHAMSWAYASGTTQLATSGTARLVAVTAQQDENPKTPRSRVYLSDDRGVTWREQPNALAAMPTAAVHSGPNMVRHPEFGLVVPFGQETTIGSNKQNFLARSADAGETWEIKTWLNATASRNVEPSLATWGSGHMVIIGRDYNEATGYDAASGKYYYTQNVYKHTPGAPFSAVTFATARTNIAGNGATAKAKGKNAREAHDTPDVIYNPVTGRIEMIQSSRWGNGAENPLPADPTDPTQCNNSLNLWSIDPVDLLASGTTWRFDGNLVERQGIILGGAAGTYGEKGNKDGYHPGGSIVDEAAGKQHIFIYVGVYTQYANAYRLSRPLDTYAFRAACDLPPLPAPAVTGAAVSGNTVTITGINFTALKEVLVAGKTAVFSPTYSITEIKATLPAGVTAVNPVNPADLVVRTDHGITRGLSDPATLPPAVSAISYETIWPGNPITITGVKLAGVATVLFGDMAITNFVSHTDTEIVVNVPAGVPAGAITLKTAGGDIVPLPMSGSYTVAEKPSALAPLVATQPVVIGLHPLDLIASATGVPAPSFKWQYRSGGSGDWADIPGSVDYQGANTAHLSIVNTAGKNGWQYRYAAMNHTEDVYSDTVTLRLLAETFTAPAGLTATSGTSGPDLYVADAQAHVIRKITQADGKAVVFAGQSGVSGHADGAASAALFNEPRGVAITAAGALVVADTGNNAIRLVTADGAVSTLSTAFNKPRAVAAHDQNNEIYVADTGNHLIKKITADSAVSIIAGAAVPGFANGSGPAAQFNTPSGIAVDVAGNLYVADTGNNAIRYIDMTTGSVSTFAGRPLVAPGHNDGAKTTTATFNAPEGVAVDAGGWVFVADTGNSHIRTIRSGTVFHTALYPEGFSNYAGFKDGRDSNPGDVLFDHPSSIVVAEDGYLYVADTGNAAIRRIDNGSDVTTLSIEPLTGNSDSPGNGTGGGSGGGGGGAPGWWFIAALAALITTRAFVCRR
ncbi:IPT/TIG domain-containing protein [Termitidicoccus mucosus]|uniref:IPT/TIG domain-containing protein n=1 Tax=Termitidicoccus mucosus TaxID=1184151 RepID=A0A178ILP6_9BACT|nr:hypothetical protein AW736_06305 [Opitutaceae bacterium TSB47]